MNARTVWFWIAVLSTLTGCSGSSGSGNRAIADTAAVSANTSPPNASPMPAAPVSTVTDSSIVAALADANQTELAEAHLALQKSSNTQVKAFARQMIADHSKLLRAGNALADSIGVKPVSPTADSMSQKTNRDADTLVAAKGSAFDRLYMDAEVRDHATVLTMLKRLAAQAQNPRLKALITNAEPAVQTHLSRAQAIDAKLQPNA